MASRGYGNVSLGAQEVLDALGAVVLAPADLDGLFAAPAARRAVHQVVFAEHDMVARRDATAPFDLDEYLAVRSCTRARSSAGCRA